MQTDAYGPNIVAGALYMQVDLGFGKGLRKENQLEVVCKSPSRYREGSGMQDATL